MVKADMEKRLKSVILNMEGGKSSKEVALLFGISTRTLRRWKTAYRHKGTEGLMPKPTIARRLRHAMPKALEKRILELKQKHPSWGARRIKYQYDLPVSWRSVHRVIKTNGMLIRIKPKPQPCKRFQRKHVDSMWQGDTFQFRIKGVGKVYVTGFTDDCSRYRVFSGTYMNKNAEASIPCLKNALKKGRIPREIYLDNGGQFIDAEFKAVADEYDTKLIYGKPYHPRGRGKIEAYHKALYRELILAIRFKSLEHFRQELKKFDKRYNEWRKQEIHGWKTPASIYNDSRYFNKSYRQNLKNGQMLLQQKRT